MGSALLIHFYNNPFTILLHSFRTGFYILFTLLFYSQTSTSPTGGGGVFIFLVRGCILPIPAHKLFSLIRLKALGLWLIEEGVWGS